MHVNTRPFPLESLCGKSYAGKESDLSADDDDDDSSSITTPASHCRAGANAVNCYGTKCNVYSTVQL